jgi:hypothetical protein
LYGSCHHPFQRWGFIIQDKQRNKLQIPSADNLWLRGFAHLLLVLAATELISAIGFAAGVQALAIGTSAFGFCFLANVGLCCRLGGIANNQLTDALTNMIEPD